MTAPSGNKRGRPFKSDVKALTPGNRNAVGRPKGDAAIIKTSIKLVCLIPLSQVLYLKRYLMRL